MLYAICTTLLYPYSLQLPIAPVAAGAPPLICKRLYEIGSSSSTSNSSDEDSSIASMAFNAKGDMLAAITEQGSLKL
jgi:hypothetical protein